MSLALEYSLGGDFCSNPRSIDGVEHKISPGMVDYQHMKPSFVAEIRQFKPNFYHRQQGPPGLSPGMPWPAATYAEESGGTAPAPPYKTRDSTTLGEGFHRSCETVSSKEDVCAIALMWHLFFLASITWICLRWLHMPLATYTIHSTWFSPPLWWLSLYLFGGSVGSSSKKQLLAHDGWSEIWEIILLASGDVERNPGPKYITEEELKQVSEIVVGEDSLLTAFDEVHPIRSNWLTFCCCLGLRASLLDAIAKEHPKNTGECLFDGLKNWVRKNYNTEKHGPPTWRKLVEAVDNSSGGENHALALKIAKKHKNSDSLQATEEGGEPSVVIADEVMITLAKKCKAVAVVGEARSSSDSTDLQRQQMSSAFNRMYRSVIGHLLRVDVEEVKESLRYLTKPQCLSELCVPRRVYKSATTTKDLLDKLCPTYVNPEDTFVLKEIVNEFGSRRCQKELKGYIHKFL